MKLLLAAFGKPHEPYVKTGVDDFTQRINRYFPAAWLILPPPKNAAALTPEAYKKKEAEIFLPKLETGDYLVCLDERGKAFNNHQLAQFVEARAGESVKRLIFLIGGAYGIEETVLKAARLSWSLSALVFPHQLVRLILAEQLYRTCTILHNEKYHH